MRVLTSLIQRVPAGNDEITPASQDERAFTVSVDERTLTCQDKFTPAADGEGFTLPIGRFADLWVCS